MAYGTDPGDDPIPTRDEMLLAEDDAEYAIATQPCPYCDARTGQPCRNKITGDRLHSARFTHPARARAAAAANPEDVF